MLDKEDSTVIDEQVQKFKDKYFRGEYRLDVIPNTELDYEGNKRERDTNAVIAFGETRLAAFIRDMK